MDMQPRSLPTYRCTTQSSNIPHPRRISLLPCTCPPTTTNQDTAHHRRL